MGRIDYSLAKSATTIEAIHTSTLVSIVNCVLIILSAILAILVVRHVSGLEKELLKNEADVVPHTHHDFLPKAQSAAV